MLFSPVDVPVAGPATIRAVLEGAPQAAVAVAAWRDRPGHPVRLSLAAAQAVMAAPVGAISRDVLAAFGPECVAVDDPGVVENWNFASDVSVRGA